MVSHAPSISLTTPDTIHHWYNAQPIQGAPISSMIPLGITKWNHQRKMGIPDKLN